MGDASERRRLASEALDGYVNGPAAAVEATRRALTRVAEIEPDTLILVEGISDQMAVEAAALSRSRDLEAEGVVVLPVGGAQAVPSFLRRFGTGPVPATERLLDSQGDLRPFRTLQKQPAWRGRPHDTQLRRFLGSGARRKLRYARLMAGAVEPDRLPPPLLALLDDV